MIVARSDGATFRHKDSNRSGSRKDLSRPLLMIRSNCSCLPEYQNVTRIVLSRACSNAMGISSGLPTKSQRMPESRTSCVKLSTDILLNKGTVTAPMHWMAKSTATHQGDDGAISPTLSPLPTPSSRRPRERCSTVRRSSR